MQPDNMFNLSGRTILITGAAGGIGAEAARVCGKLGAQLVLTDIGSMSELASELQQTDIAARSYKLDITDRTAVEDLARHEHVVDAVVASAAISPFDDWIEAPDWDETFHRTMTINVLGTINVVRAWYPGMTDRKRGSVVVIGSLSGKSGGMFPNQQPHYVASKAGIHGFVRWLSKRAILHNVNVNGIAPGPVQTGMNAHIKRDLSLLPMGRMGRPDEIAWPIAFLCSPAASYISGAILDVNGGTFVG
jgi:NAD(P)-dependent dehydrogenase (short-subunit alcohol dehydrogenase family)